MFPSDSPTTVVHFTHYKAGSQWIHRILNRCCAERIVKPEVFGRHLTDCPIQAGRIYPTVYLPRTTIDRMTLPKNTRSFTVVRDPRDTMVSLYFSFKVSHPLDGSVDPELRRRLQGLSPEAGFLEILQAPVMQEIMDIHLSWRASEVPLLHYEDLIHRDVELLLPILTEHCLLNIAPEVIRAAIEESRFEQVAGRRPGVSDLHSHFRQGLPGDWKRHFSTTVAETFHQKYGDRLIEWGYAMDSNWVDEAAAPSRLVATKPIRSHQSRSYSIILSLPDHRGHAMAAVESWLDKIRWPQDRLELIVVSDGSDPQTATQVRSRIQDRARWIEDVGAVRTRLLDQAVEVAQHDTLLFTEGHVEPEADFLMQLDDWWQANPSMEAAFSRVIPVYENAIGYWENRICDEAVQKHRDGNPWWNINIHAFALSRRRYLEAGGLDGTYDLFSLILLADQLQHLGVSIGYAASAAVLHHYPDNIEAIEAQIRRFVRDELRYRELHPGPDRLGFTALPPHEDSTIQPLRREAIRAIEQTRIGAPSWQQAVNTIRRAFGPRDRVSFDEACNEHSLRLALEACRDDCRKAKSDRRDSERPCLRLRQLVVADEIRRFECESDSESSSCLAPIPVGVELIANDASLKSSVVGLHGNEVYQETGFRWSEPVSVWRFEASQPRNKLQFELLPVRRDLRSRAITAFWDGRRVASSQIHCAADRLTIELPHTSECNTDNVTLVLKVPRMKVAKDSHDREHRELGLPIKAIRYGH